MECSTSCTIPIVLCMNIPLRKKNFLVEMTLDKKRLSLISKTMDMKFGYISSCSLLVEFFKIPICRLDVAYDGVFFFKYLESISIVMERNW